MPAAESVWTTLRHRDFRRLWIGQSVSAAGDQLFTVAFAVLVLEAGGGTGGLGLVLAARALSLAAFVLVGGIFADRVRRTHVMIAADVLRAIAVVGIVTLDAEHSIWVAAILMFLVGAGEALFRPAYRSLLPRTLPSSALQAGNALTSISLRSAAILGPALAGVLIGLVGARVALVVDAATFVVSLATLVTISDSGAPQRTTLRIAQDVTEGIAAIRERPWIGAVLAMAGVQVTLAVSPWIVLLPVVAREDLGGNGAYSVLLTVFGVGSIVGALLAGRWRPHAPGAVALLALVPTAAMLLALAIPVPVWLAAVTHGFAGLGEELFAVLWVTALQREVPDRLLGRVISLDYLVSLAFVPVGLAVVGPVASALGPSAVLYFGSALIVVTTLPLLALDSVRRFANPRPLSDEPRAGVSSNHGERPRPAAQAP